jgi:hypothetical protein
VPIKSSSAREVDRLVEQIREGSPVEREAAVARLRVIGARAVDRLAAVVRSGSDVSRAAALKALEGMDDPRARDVALDSVAAEPPAVAAAAIAALRTWLATDPVVLDAVTGIALDKRQDSALRLAALDALAELPRATIQPVLQQVGGDDPALAARAEGQPTATLDHPAGVREWLVLRGEQAPLSELHDAIVRIRAAERQEPSGRRRQEWEAVRGAIHHLLAHRASRVALYDLRETLEGAQGTLPLDFLNAVAILGDGSCLEPLARAWSSAEKELWWRDRLADAARAIVANERLTARHAVIKRVRSRFPGLL